MSQSLSHTVARRNAARASGEREGERIAAGSGLDRALRIGIVGSGIVVLALLSWVHLGLGALAMPPRPTAYTQVATAGAYHVRFASRPLTADGPNAVTLMALGATNQPIAGATIVVAPEMATMAMTAPSVSAVTDSSGKVVIHPQFGMAGDWRLHLTIQSPGAPPEHVSFLVSVRWR